MINHRHVQHAIIRYSTRCLSIPWSTSHTHIHHLALHRIAIDANVHLIFHTMKYHEENGNDERERSRAQQRTCLTTQVHHVSYQPHVNTVQEIAVARLSILVCISDTSQVNFTDTMLHEPVNGLFQIAFLEVPITSKIVHYPVGNHTQGNLIAHLSLHLHQTVHCIVQGGVTSHYDDGFVTIVNKHIHQSLNAFRRFALYKVEIYFALVQQPLYLLTLLTGICLRAIQDAPSSIRFAHKLVIINYDYSLPLIFLFPLLSPPSVARRQSNGW